MSDKDFTYQLLQRVDMSGADLKNVSFDNAVLDDVNFKDCDLRGASFRGADLRKVHITLGCRTFKGVKLDAFHVKMLLALLLESNMDDTALDVSTLRNFLNNHDNVSIRDILENMFTQNDWESIQAYFRSVYP